jgi:type IV secretion system protein VirB5
MNFPTVTTSYGRKNAPADSPYARAAAAWDERIGSARVQARNWRLAACMSLLLALVLGAGVVVMGVKKQVATYVVEVDKLGMPGRITLANQAYQPTSAQVGYFVGQLVRLVRERPLDPVVMRQQWMQAYQFLAGSAVNAMNEFAATDSGLASKAGGGIARTVQISNILQKSNTTYQVRWLETTYVNGIKRSEEPWTGLFEVKLIPPRNEADVFNNPLGCYVTEFTWSREFAGPVRSDAPPQDTPSASSDPHNP